QPAVSRISVLEIPIAGLFAERAAPRVSERVRVPMRETLGDLRRQGMVGGASRIRGHDDGSILRIRDNEVIRESVFREQPAGRSGNDGRRIQSTGEAAHLTGVQ